MALYSFPEPVFPDSVLDGYPVNRLMHGIALALMTVQTQTISILDEDRLSEQMTMPGKDYEPPKENKKQQEQKPKTRLRVAGSSPM